MGDFEVDTRVEGGGGRYGARLSSDWEIFGANGGYVAAIALRAAGLEAAFPRPTSFSCTFLHNARFRPVDLEVETLYRGRNVEALRVRMRQAGRPVLEGLVRAAGEVEGLEHDCAVAPEVPDPEELKSYDELFPEEATLLPIWRNLEVRPTRVETLEEALKPREPVFRGWHRLRPRATFDDVFVDAGRMLVLLDTFAWVTAQRPHPNPRLGAPNIDLSAWFHRADPSGEWLLSDHACPVAERGLMGANGRIWSRDGRLLASGGSQLLCISLTAALTRAADDGDA